MKKCYIGIDPGRDGAIVALDTNGILVFKGVIPFDAELNNFNILGFCKILDGIRKQYDKVFVITEKLRPIFGVNANSTFRLGMAYQCVLDAVKIMKLGYTDVRPTVWTGLMWKGLEEIRKPSKTNKKGALVKGRLDSKMMSLQAVKKYFPDLDLRKSEKSSKFHDGIVDALLLAEYGRRNNL